jgi:hypothetical protein
MKDDLEPNSSKNIDRLTTTISTRTSEVTTVVSTVSTNTQTHQLSTITNSPLKTNNIMTSTTVFPILLTLNKSEWEQIKGERVLPWIWQPKSKPKPNVIDIVMKHLFNTSFKEMHSGSKSPPKVFMLPAAEHFNRSDINQSDPFVQIAMRAHDILRKHENDSESSHFTTWEKEIRREIQSNKD